jgi:hypothetical protein
MDASASAAAAGGGAGGHAAPAAAPVFSAASSSSSSSSSSSAVGDVAAALAARAQPDRGLASAESAAALARVEEVARLAQSQSRAMVARRAPAAVAAPKWHAPWRLMRVIAGHQGWVRSVAVDPGNEWFATGAADRTIKVWDLASGALKLTLTGHINTVRGLCVSARHPYLFSAGEDKMIKCCECDPGRACFRARARVRARACVSAAARNGLAPLAALARKYAFAADTLARRPNSLATPHRVPTNPPPRSFIDRRGPRDEQGHPSLPRPPARRLRALAAPDARRAR